MLYRPDFWPDRDRSQYKRFVEAADGGLRVYDWVGVLDMCLSLHMNHTGADQGLTDEKKALYIKCLRYVLQNPRQHESHFDRLVRELVVTVLSEQGACPEEHKPSCRATYNVSFPIGEEGPDGQTQEVGFNFESPPTRDDVVKAVNAAVEDYRQKSSSSDVSRMRQQHEDYMRHKAEYAVALLDFFKYLDEYPNTKLWSKGVVIRNDKP